MSADVRELLPWCWCYARVQEKRVSLTTFSLCILPRSSSGWPVGSCEEVMAQFPWFGSSITKQLLGAGSSGLTLSITYWEKTFMTRKDRRRRQLRTGESDLIIQSNRDAWVPRFQDAWFVHILIVWISDWAFQLICTYKRQHFFLVPRRTRIKSMVYLTIDGNR